MLTSGVLRCNHPGFSCNHMLFDDCVLRTDTWEEEAIYIVSIDTISEIWPCHSEPVTDTTMEHAVRQA